MRDPDRIDRMVEKLRMLWHKNPDQRLGQLVDNLLGDHERTWIVEDDVAERKIDRAAVGGLAAASETR